LRKKRPSFKEICQIQPWQASLRGFKFSTQGSKRRSFEGKILYFERKDTYFSTGFSPSVSPQGDEIFSPIN